MTVRTRPVALFGLLLSGVGCAACTASGLEATAAASAGLTPAAAVYVAVPPDAHFGSRDYAGSGSEVAANIAEALSQCVSRVHVAPEPQSARKDLGEARARGFTYLIRPTILRWEDNDSAWLGGPDRATVLVETIEAASGYAADVAVIEAKPVTSAPGPAQTPADALQTPLPAYAARLFGAQAATARR